MWWMGIVIIVQTYTANLAAFLTASRLNNDINSIEDLGSQTKVIYGTNEWAAPHEFFMVSKIRLYEDMLYFMEENGGFVNDTSEGVKRVRNSNYAFIWDDVVLDFIVQSKPCNTLKTVGRRFGKIGFGFGLQKNSPYTRQLSSYISHLREIGYIDAIKQKWWVERSECNNEEGTVDGEPDAALAAAGGRMGIPHMLGVFYIIYGGLVIGVIVLVFEWIFALTTSSSNTGFTTLQEGPTTFKEALGLRLRLLHRDIIDDWLPALPYNCRQGNKVQQTRQEELDEINKNYQELQYRSLVSMRSAFSDHDITLPIASSFPDQRAGNVYNLYPSGSQHLTLPNMVT